jgi:hypothetical protein
VQVVKRLFTGLYLLFLAVALSIVEPDNEPDEQAHRSRSEYDEFLIGQLNVGGSLRAEREGRAQTQNDTTDNAPTTNPANSGGVKVTPPQPDTTEKHANVGSRREKNPEYNRLKGLIEPDRLGKMSEKQATSESPNNDESHPPV